MRLRRWIVGTMASVFAAGCSKAPAPMTNAERAALADSVSQMVTDMFASLKKDASADRILSYYVSGDELVMVNSGRIFSTHDSLKKVLRSVFAPGTKVALAADQKHVTVLDRDVVVFTAIFNGMYTDPAGHELPVQDEAWMGVYHRTADGWKIAVEHESFPPPAPTPAPAKPARRVR